jgi:hypothetical protein
MDHLRIMEPIPHLPPAAVRYLQQRGPQGPLLERKGRMVPVQEIRERVERQEYDVDAERVAAAILARLLAERTDRRGEEPPEHP